MVETSARLRVYHFSVPGEPMGKPRMTQRDVWQKRPVVLRYRAYCDCIRFHAKQIPKRPVSLQIRAYLPMPPSWSERKRQAFEGAVHRQKPDYDNIAKAVGDALFQDDSLIVCGSCTKFWCREPEARTDVTVLFEDSEEPC